MRADEWIATFLINKKVTDVFGIPGAVILDFLYAIERHKPTIQPHLCFHEQGAAFAACGYAQTTGNLGVAYATRGPGFTNMLTAIADAYYDSVPVMFITAHATLNADHRMRVMNNQEIDTVSIASSVTKRAVRIDEIESLQKEFVLAYNAAMSGRKGPVFLDIYSGLFSKDVNIDAGFIESEIATEIEKDDVATKKFAENMKAKLKESKHPVVLIGNGAREAKTEIKRIAEKFNIPILSSRTAQDILPESKMYFGYVGSRATRYSNFILSKADLIISLGNRLSFPVNSKSFWPIVENASIVRVDIDKTEFCRNIPNADNYELDVRQAVQYLLMQDLYYENNVEWIDSCKYLKQQLNFWDRNSVVSSIENIMRSSLPTATFVCDVGNHSFWVTAAYTYAEVQNRILYSGSFGTLGSALPKAIGAYYATRRPVVCFTGDQGAQFNIQELQCIASNQLPVTVVILNNCSSGMIMEREIAKFDDYLVHTTVDDGYSYPSFEKIARSYGVRYISVDVEKSDNESMSIGSEPTIIEMFIDRNTELCPRLPVGRVCQDLEPDLPRDMFDTLNNI